MSINGLRDAFAREDLYALAKRYRIRNADGIFATVESAVSSWPKFAVLADIRDETRDRIAAAHRALG
jgi:hypothetical protein